MNFPAVLTRQNQCSSWVVCTTAELLNLGEFRRMTNLTRRHHSQLFQIGSHAANETLFGLLVKHGELVLNNLCKGYSEYGSTCALRPR